MSAWSKWLMALAVGVALVGVPAAEAAATNPAASTSHKLVVIKKHKAKHHSKKTSKHALHTSVKKTKSVSAASSKGKKATVLAKSNAKKPALLAKGSSKKSALLAKNTTKKPSAVKWHHPQLHNA